MEGARGRDRGEGDKRGDGASRGVVVVGCVCAGKYTCAYTSLRQLSDD